MTIETDFLNCAAEKLDQLCERIETCLGKLTPEQIWMRGTENQNAVGNLVLHLNGNVRQWILSGVGGEPDHRVRDEEFSARGGMEPEALGRLVATSGGSSAARSSVRCRTSGWPNAPPSRGTM